MSKARNRWIGLIFVSMSIALVIIDGTIVNTIFPSLISDLKLTSTEVQWVQESYVLVFASLLLVWGSLADRVGRKLLLMIGITIFVASSMWAGLTDSASVLILARVIQGIGGAMVLPTTLSLVNANFQGKERGIAFAIWGSTIGGMVAVGPVLGGWLATDFSWRWAFFINAPFGVLILAGLAYFIAESKVAQRDGGIDIVGAAISVVMFSTFVFALIEGRIYGWWDINTKNQFTIGDFEWPTTGISVIPVSFAIAIVATIIFVFWEKRREAQHKNVLLDLQLFHIASFRNGSIAAAIISMGEFGILFAIPLWLQNVIGLSPVSSGLVLLWLAGGAFVASGVGGALSGRLPASRAVQIGVGLELIGVAGVAIFASPESGWGVIAPFLFVYGIGIGLATAQLTGVIMVEVPPQQIGQGSGSQSTVRQIGSAMGIAVLGTLLFTGTQSSLESKLSATDIPAEQQALIVDAVVDSAGSAIPEISDALVAQRVPQDIADGIQTDAGEAFTDGAKLAAWSAAFFLLLGFASTFNLGVRKPKKKAQV
ncbi:MAG: DHA2 family efflux MFS transporter permease subunit [Microbacteriaceae bacterium]